MALTYAEESLLDDYSESFPYEITRGVFRGGYGGLAPPPGPVKSIDFRVFSGLNGC